jgi:hypothetical protein
MKKQFLYLMLVLSTSKLSAQTNCYDYVSVPYTPPNAEIPITSAIPYAGGYASLTAWVKYGVENGIQRTQLKKPFIFVEGIDFKVCSKDHKYGDFGWPDFITGDYEADKEDNTFKQLPVLLNKLTEEGYDIVMVDFHDGATYIQRNSFALIELIKEVNRIKEEKTPLIVAGASMGGQVARYALAYMERNNIQHCSQMYISFDSPHKGANIPISLQHTIKFLAETMEIPDAAETLNKKLNREAARQLLLHHHSVSTGPDPLRNTYMSELNTLSYPGKLRKIAIANGNKLGISQPFSAGTALFDWEASVPACLGADIINLKAYSLPGNNAFGNLIYTSKMPKNGITSVLTCLSSYATVLASPAYGMLIGAIGCNVCINETIGFHTSYLSLNNALPSIDNAPGGTYNVAKELGKKIEGSSEYNAIESSPSALITNKLKYDVPAQCFIPTVSALDIKVSMNNTGLFYNVNNNINPNQPSSLYPFEAYWATTDPNEQHVEITGGLTSGNIQWVLQQLEKGTSKLQPVLTSSSPNSGVFNFGRYESRFLTDVDIYNGGKLFVNNTGVTDYGTGTATINGSTYNLETCDCNVQVNIGNNGEFILGRANPNNKAIVLFKSGSTLKISNGGRLIINNNSRLIIEEGATLIFEQGAEIQLVGDNAVLEIKGQLRIGDNATFTFTYPQNSQSGYILFSGNAQANGVIVGGSNSSIRLRGANRSDKILEVTIPSLNIPSTVNSLTIAQGTVELGLNSEIFSDADLTLTSSVIKSGKGVRTTKGVNVVSCEFDRCLNGIRSQTFLSAHPVRVHNTTFKTIDTGIESYGGGLDIFGCTFESSNIGVRIVAGLFNNKINLSTFRYNFLPIIADNAVSGEIQVHRTTMLNNQPQYSSGISLVGSSLSLSCSSIDGFWESLSLGENSILNMSTLENGGYNRFKNNTTPINLYDAADIFLERGNNDFSGQFTGNPGQEEKFCIYGLDNCLKRIKGTMAGYFYPTCSPGTINARENQWSSRPLLFHPEFASVKTAEKCGNDYVAIPVSERTPMNPMPCGFYSTGGNGGSSDPVSLAASARYSCPGCQVINTADFRNERLNLALLKALDQAKKETPGDNKIAVSMLSQILKHPNPNKDEKERLLRSVAYRRLQEVIGRAIEKGELVSSIQTPEIAELIDIQDQLIAESGPLTAENYFQHLYLNMDRVQALRAANRRDLALARINEMLLWTRQEQRTYVERWKCYIESEEALISASIDDYEFEERIKGCPSLNRNHNVHPSAFGIGINPSQPNHDLHGVISKEQLTVFPNPSSEKIEIQFNFSEAKSATILLTDLSGKTVLKILDNKLFENGYHSLEANINTIPNGIYMVVVKTESEFFQQRLVVVK